MKKIKIILLILMIFVNSIYTTGCWNYREIDKLAIVAGIAVDKGANGQYKITVETADISGEREMKIKSKIYLMEGKTMFDAARNVISISGKRLYWSHTKILILSKEVASDGVVKIIDWFNTDSEPRPDAHILISKEASAGELINQGEKEIIKSFEIEDTIKNQESVSKAPIVDVLQFDNDVGAKGVAPIAPAISLKQGDGGMVPYVSGTAIFKGDKLQGFLNSEETKSLLFIKNKVKGGLLIEGVEGDKISTPVSLEIFKSKTKVKPITTGKDIRISINVDTTVANDEIEGTEDLNTEEGRKKVEQSAETNLKEGIVALIEKMQTEYGLDIFGFSSKLREDKTKVWNRVSNNWGDVFKNLKVSVTTKVHIQNSALLSKPLEVGD